MAFNIWRFTDGKPGHDSQSIGLCNALDKQKACNRIDIPIDSFSTSLTNILLERFPPGKDFPDPNLIIGAGHGTHIPMLSAKRARGGKTVVLMKPSLPLCLFDTCIIPEHDAPPRRNNVIITTGALNPVAFNSDKQANTGLILLGGLSKHYKWDNNTIIDQITQIINNNKTINWAIADSPRTPENLLNTISGLSFKNINTLSYKETDTEKMHKLVFEAETIWVSSDSISMIYESLSSGAHVGLLNVIQKKDSRLNNAIKTLVSEKQLTTFYNWQKEKTFKINKTKLQESERCAKLLLDRGTLD